MSRHATETFTMDHGVLLRSVVPARGKPYLHSCTQKVFEEVCNAIDECHGEAFTGEDLVAGIDHPSTQIFTAVAFLRERSIVETARGHKNVAPTTFDVFLDGMTEWYALHEERA